MARFLMVADDFTGSGDAGVQMSKNGIESYIAFDAKSIDPKKSYVIDTESRNIPAQEAYEKVKQIYESVQPYQYDHYYKKIDSTLRGNIKAELQAADEVLKPDLIVFNPANPDSNRTVVDGILMMNGVRICETEIMRDPLCLVQQDNLRILLEEELEEPIQYFTLAQIRNKDLKLEGPRILTFDVLENVDLKNVVEFVLQQKKRVLWVGSAGMANALFSALNPGYPVLGIVGSISETSRGQVRVAVEAGAKLVELNVADLIRGGSIAPVAEEVVERLKLGQDVIVVSAKEQADYLDAVDAGKKSGMTRQEVAQFTQKKLGELSVEILKRAKVCGCILTGGDTAISVHDHNHAHGAKLIQEVFPIVALIELDGGDSPGLRCIVKGGSIGTPDTIAEAIRFFKQ
ncbi:four-carbon acid sugar kinase family protein [Drancourtella massiliensis]|uniref:Four-carbon acid sugar kinase family protein n=1 Tax=Drancourtella massiliensis TaxID=1632013 RepID=A0ABS2EDR8_9FIRM|nr:four-carbon acid sugar kinase family protein [Drancourtella massiliensis]MBM6743135.1 four-carbon acid sugar kinase family protein [Drancourtella massiliensis]